MIWWNSSRPIGSTDANPEISRGLRVLIRFDNILVIALRLATNILLNLITKPKKMSTVAE